MAIIPPEIRGVAEVLEGAGFRAYLVGGCVRDLLLGREPKDWDIATDAVPDKIQRLFPDSAYENNFGTVLVKMRDTRYMIHTVEVTTFRKEGKYTDARHPDEVKFAKTIEEDLARRDFTVNAMALRLREYANSREYTNGIVDPYGGQRDLDKKLIRAVGEPDERFSEDALRLMRAVRFAAELGFEVEEHTAAAVVKHAGTLQMIAKERVRDEFVKIVMSPSPARGVQMLESLGLLRSIAPEVREGIGCGQNLHHIYDVWEHSLRALQYAADKGYPLHVRLAALLHDIGKPRTKRGEGTFSTFHAHEVVGGRMARAFMERFVFPRDLAEAVTHLVRSHMFFYNVGEVSEAGVRRFLARVGVEYLLDLIKVREADRIGSGVPKAKPYKIRHLLFMIEKVRRDPTSPKMLAVKGDGVMRIAGIAPGPRVGWIIAALMDEVLDDPARNTPEYLGNRIAELAELDDAALRERASRGKEKIAETEKEAEEEIRGRHGV